MTNQGHRLPGSFVYVWALMRVNRWQWMGGTPCTNPHLSSWITDIINRRCSSISPVFPIQRWEAGRFPTADLMTFTKLPYACPVCVYVCSTLYFSVYTHSMYSTGAWQTQCHCFLCYNNNSGSILVETTVWFSQVMFVISLSLFLHFPFMFFIL